MNDWSDIEIDVFYKGTGKILNQFVLPVLKKSKSYDRLTGFFSISSLVDASSGLECVWRNTGRMRLVLGLHDIPKEVLLAHKRQTDQQLIEQVENRLLVEATSLSDEFQRDSIAAIAWMMKSGFLEIRIAEPIGMGPKFIFHSKRLIFRDSHGNVITATGSPNETSAGLDGNYEDLTVHTSWEGNPRYVETHVNHFESVWDNNDSDLRVHRFSDDFIERLMAALNQDAEKIPSLFLKSDTASKVLDAIQSAPYLAHLSYANAILYPHQERALRDGLNRNAIRLMLADEVGLGKTLEAGALISHAIRFTGVKRVCILAPASLTRQFQEELQSFFGLRFFVWNSDEKIYRDASQIAYEGKKVKHPLDKGCPGFVIISAQLARGTKSTPSVLDRAEELPQMLVVDEAHAARIRFQGGSSRPTRLWRTLNNVSQRVQHLVLLTATPIQLDPLEFHCLLRLIGLPGSWDNESNYLRSLEFLGGQVKTPRLQDASLMVKLVKDASAAGGQATSELSDELRTALGKIRTDGISHNQAAIYVSQNWLLYCELLNRLHPAHDLVIRNTRRGLAKFGYIFPKREFVAPDLEVDGRLKLFFENLDDYLDGCYGEVEVASNPTFQMSRGFAKVGYQQRLASSLFAAQQSLRKRLRKIELIEDGAVVHEVDEEDFSDAEEDEGEEVEVRQGFQSDQVRESVSAAAVVEKGYLRGLLKQLDDIPDGVLKGDPKFDKAIQLIRANIRESKLLVFSKYTDTLDGFMEFLTSSHRDLFDLGIGMYTGKDSWVQKKSSRSRVNKIQLKKSLDRDEIRIVLCSEAASEGLNLQAARYLINLDVPWNPARLEQRIGRIARLGQVAPVVTISNLWYPESVEARIYRRLLLRQDLYELAVGEFPDVVGGIIKNHARVRTFSSDSGVEHEAIARLEEARLNIQQSALSKVWDVTAYSESDSKQVLSRLGEFVSQLNERSEAADGPVTFGSAQISRLPTGNTSLANSVELLKVVALQQTWGFCVRTPEGLKLVNQRYLVDLLSAALRHQALGQEHCSKGVYSDQDLLKVAQQQIDDGFPGPISSEYRFSSTEEKVPWVNRNQATLKLESLGQIPWD